MKTSKTCKCEKKVSPKIVSGRLYNLGGITVRAFGMANGKRLVVLHKTLSGFVNDCDLKPITKKAVAQYLEKADFSH